MKYYYNPSIDPHYNLALEEHFFRHLDDIGEVFILWQNNNTIVVGKHQNTIEEVNSEFIKQQEIRIVRRITGGGAVYHDLGNINYSFITKYTANNLDFRLLTAPIIEALKKLGIEVQFDSRNDLTIEGKKFSGNAQYIAKNKILHHGTILFDSNLSIMNNALQVKGTKYESKSVKSVSSRVTNIKPYLSNKELTAKDFINILQRTISKEIEMDEYYLSESWHREIQQLAKNKYSSWEWNYGQSTPYNMVNEKKFSFGTVSVRMLVEEGKIIHAKIYGDFFGNMDVKSIEEMLIGKFHNRESICNAIRSIDMNQYIFGINNDEFVCLIVN